MTLVIAHRGASRYAPENTLRAFELAKRQRADMIELDVQISADNTAVVFHDETTERWDGRARLVRHCTFAELRALDIGGERIATLAETLSFAREQQIRLNIELKGVGIAAQTAQLVKDAGATDLVLISSFWSAALHEMAIVAPDLPRAYLMGTETLRPDVRLRESWPFRALHAVGAAAWHPAHQIPFLTAVLPRVRRAGYTVNVWTVNDPAMMRRLIDLGADGIITDTPDILRGIIDAGQSR